MHTADDDKVSSGIIMQITEPWLTTADVQKSTILGVNRRYLVDVGLWKHIRINLFSVCVVSRGTGLRNVSKSVLCSSSGDLGLST